MKEEEGKRGKQGRKEKIKESKRNYKNSFFLRVLKNPIFF